MKFLNFCNRIIEYSFYALFLLTPLALSKDTSELFELNKMWLTWGLTIVIVASWLIKMVLQKKFIFQRTPLDIPIGLFLLSQIISTIFSLDPRTSLWGYYSRFNGGLFSIISYILLYYAFLSNFGNNQDVQKPNKTIFLIAAVIITSILSLISVVNTGFSFLTFCVFSLSIIFFLSTWHLSEGMIKRSIILSLISGTIVALWGLLSHFGYDPTCLLFRGTFDVSCWTAEFLPKVRIFSTLGQPDWLAAYLAILIPIAIAYLLKNSKSEAPNPKQFQNSNSQITKTFLNFGNWNLFRISIFVLLILFYVDLLYTLARSGFLAVWISLAFFLGTYAWTSTKSNKSFITHILLLGFLGPLFAALAQRKNLRSLIINPLSLIITLLLLLTFIIGAPITQLRAFTLGGIIDQVKKIQVSKTINKSTPIPSPTRSAESGGTESGNIRLLVWEGALSAWKANPIFGTGVETFAFAYYKYKPTGQNLTSEWNFLYNKAHNEFLNYLATTGIVGLSSYLLMIGSFLFLAIRKISKSEFLISNQIPSSKSQLGQLEIRSIRNLTLALLASYVSILVTNFFGFSVVMTNIYLFMIPSFVFVLNGTLPRNESGIKNHESSNLYQWTAVFFIILASSFMILGLFRFWRADIAFALGYNLDRAGEYQQGYPNLRKAVDLRAGEPVFKDELSLNEAVIAVGLLSQKPSDEASKDQAINTANSLAQDAINLSNEVVSQYPNNVVFWKNRVRLFFTLSQVDSRYLSRALDAIKKASLLAPNDANIQYNLGVLYGQNNNLDQGISVLEKVIVLRPGYREAHYALGLFYHQKGEDQKAAAQMQFILDHISPTDADALKSLSDWTK